MLGNGGPNGSGGPLSWGYNTITEIDEVFPITVSGTTFNSHDFFTDHGTVTRGSHSSSWSITNNAMVVQGDSGGADFIYNSTTRKWELAGINEASGSWTGANGDPSLGDGTFAAFVQLSYYVSQINKNTVPVPTDTPAMPLPALVGMAGTLFLAASRYLGMKRA